MIQCGGCQALRASPQTRWLAGGCQLPHAWLECNGRQMQTCSWQFVACPDGQTLAAFAFSPRNRLRIRNPSSLKSLEATVRNSLSQDSFGCASEK